MLVHQGNLAVWHQQSELEAGKQLAEQLKVPFYYQLDAEEVIERFFLSYQQNCLKLFDKNTSLLNGLMVEIEPRLGEQRSYPAAKQGALAQALGKSKTVLDATTGWGQDSLSIFRMGYQLRCMERSTVMAVLLSNGFNRLAQQDWFQKCQLTVPELIVGDAIEQFGHLDTAPDCIYLDPMFPPKRKKSALAKKSMQVLHELIGQDEDKQQLFNAALQATAKRLVVKSPDHAPPLGNLKPSQQIKTKLLRYDIYLKT
jgi:16S rRNA (guanine1516-N2)-methyltransferase